MSFFGSIVNGVKAVFGVGQDGQNNVMKAATGIGNWIDEQQFTDQEKAVFSASMADKFGDFMTQTINENTERSRSRREIAIWVIRAEIGFLTASAIFFKFDQELAKYLYQIATDSPMGYLTLGVGAFFFGAHLVRAAKQ